MKKRTIKVIATYDMTDFIRLVFCRLLGDYVLQSDFIANSKGNNMFHLFVHCILYCVLFAYLYSTVIYTYYLFHILLLIV